MIRFTNEAPFEEVFYYREKASINLSTAMSNAVRLRVLLEVQQSPLEPFENLKFNPSRTWYGTCTRLFRGYTIDRRECEPTFSVLFDEVNESFLRRLDDFKMWRMMGDYARALGTWAYSYQVQFFQAPIWDLPPTDFNDVMLLQALGDQFEELPYCAFATENSPPIRQLDAFPFGFDQLKFVFPPSTQFAVRMQWWTPSDTCDDTINDLAQERTPQPNPFGDGAGDSYARPRRSPGGADPFEGLPSESPRFPGNDPRDYVSAPLPEPTGQTSLRVYGMVAVRNVNGDEPRYIDETFGPFDEPYTYAWVAGGQTSENPPRPMQILRIYKTDGTTIDLITNVLSQSLTIERV